jgi:hypothetical protein
MKAVKPAPEHYDLEKAREDKSGKFIGIFFFFLGARGIKPAPEHYDLEKAPEDKSGGSSLCRFGVFFLYFSGFFGRGGSTRPPLIFFPF